MSDEEQKQDPRHTKEHLDEMRNKSGQFRTAKRNERIKQLVTYDLTPKAERKELGIPHSDQGIADSIGVTVSTVKSWRLTDFYKKEYKQREQAKLEYIQPGIATIIDEGLRKELADDDLKTYQEVKGAIALKAAEGDAKATETYLKYWGKTFLDAEVTRVDALADYTDDELLAELVELVQIPALEAAIAKRLARAGGEVEDAEV